MGAAFARAIGADIVIGFILYGVSLEVDSHQAKLTVAVIGAILGLAVIVASLMWEKRRGRVKSSPAQTLVDLNDTKMKWDDNMVHGHPVGFLRATNSDVEVTGSTFVESGPLVPPPWPPSRQDDPAELQAECRNIVADLNELVEGHRDDLMDVYESTMAARVKAFYLRSRANGYWYERIERKYDSPLGLNSGGVLGLTRAMEEFVAAFDSPPGPEALFPHQV